MAAKLKRLADQVIVIMGASSGIGLATAEAAARKGARVVLAARSKQTLDDIANRLSPTGNRALAVACDVSDRGQVESVAEAAVAKFGRIDTWVNVAGLGLYGRLDQVPDEDSRRLFDINFWGVVNGCLTALPRLAHGGAIINVGSEVSEAYIPLLGMYTASKHAVKGFTNALRVEIEQLDKSPISITLIEPTAVDTPFPQHAPNFMGQEANLPTPMIEPSQVAEAILDAAVRPTRYKRVGMMAKVNTTLATVAPPLADRMAAMQAGRLHTNQPVQHHTGALNEASEATVAGHKHGNSRRKPHHSNALKKACFGATGGLIGTLAIQALMGASQKWFPQLAPPMRKEPGAFMVEKAETQLPDGLRKEIPEKVENAVAGGLGMSYGSAFGAMYSMLRPRNSNVLLDGAALGMACWAAGYLGWLPALGLMPKVTDQTPAQVAGPVANHLAYGLVTAAAYNWLSAQFGKPA